MHVSSREVLYKFSNRLETLPERVCFAITEISQTHKAKVGQHDPVNQ